MGSEQYENVELRIEWEEVSGSMTGSETVEILSC